MERDRAASVHWYQCEPGAGVDDVREGRGDGGGCVSEVNVVSVESEDGNSSLTSHYSITSPVLPVQPQHSLSRSTWSHSHQPPGLQEADTLGSAGSGAEHHLGQGLEAGDQEEMSVNHTVDQPASLEVEPGHGVDIVSRDSTVMIDQQCSSSSSSLGQPGQTLTRYFPLVENISPAQDYPGHGASQHGKDPGGRPRQQSDIIPGVSS